MTEHFTAYITKYALTKGIQEMIVQDCFDTSPTMVKSMGNYPSHFHKNQWHRTSAVAVAQAEKMRAAKIASLCKAIAKLSRMTFGGIP